MEENLNEEVIENDSQQVDTDSNEIDTNNSEDVETTETSENETDKGVDNNSQDNDVEDTKSNEISEDERAKRAYYAELKRQKKADKEKAQKESNNEKAKSGVNPFTNLPIEDEADQKELAEMLEASNRGYDPTNATDMAKYRKAKRMEQANKDKISSLEKEIADMKQKEFINSDRDKFKNEFPDVDIKELIENEDFNVFCKGRIGNESLVDIYNDYKSFKDKHDKELANERNSTQARMESSTGKLSGGDVSEESKPMTFSKYSELLRLAKERKI